MRLKLNPCQYCWGTAIFEEKVTINTAHNNRVEKTYFVRCPKCGARTLTYLTKTGAMKAWNRGLTHK